jgi:RNA polymerase sigma-70 factor, ECF subfamily
MEASEAVLAPAVSETAERLFRQHSGWIYGYCLRLLRSPQDAEDALQATYLNACRSLNAGVRPEVDSAWLLRITRNICLTRLRSSSRRARYEHVGDFALVEETLPALDRRAEDLIGLADALASLSEQQRQAILLREWQGLTHGEVAQTLGLTQAAAETLIFRARRSLAAALKNPAKRVRLRSLPALDPAGLFAAIKGFVAGGVGVNTVAAVIVVAATTAPVVATNPAGLWSDGPEPVTAPAAGHASPPVPTSGAEHSGAVARVPDKPADPIVGLGRPATDATDRGPVDGEVKPPETAKAQENGEVLTRAAEPIAPKGTGRAFGQATAESAKGNAADVSRPAHGQARNVAAGPTGSNGGGTPADGRPDAAGRAGTPPTQATGKAAKSSKSD